MNEPLKHAKWKKSYAKQATLYDSLYEMTRASKSIETRSSWAIARNMWKGKMGMATSEDMRFLFEHETNVWELRNGSMP